MAENAPWLAFYGGVPRSLRYPDRTLYEALRATADRHPDAPAWEFFGRTSTYARFLADVDAFSAALASLGVKRGSRLTIAMPTCPPGVIAFYAANRLGAVSSMIHPLSPPDDVAFYLRTSGSTLAITLDALYPRFRQARERSPLRCLILARIQDHLPFPKNLVFRLTRGRDIRPVPADADVHWWRDLTNRRLPRPPEPGSRPDDTATILFSGGTTGTPKGILLSNRNIVAEGMQAAAWGDIGPGDSMLAILPLFHGFGLGVCVNAFFMGGGKVILVPQFSAREVARLIRARRPSYLVGVPTLFEALTREPALRGADLSCLKGAFCGADRLPRPVKERFEALVRAGGGSLKLLEGYGLTETVTAVLCMPISTYREGSIGIPFPDMLAKIVVPGTTDGVEPGQDGELCIHGPAVMQGYLDQPAETAAALRRHPDGKTWLHTGDLCSMDGEGFFYFKERLKRMIKSSGMNVYPGQVESVLRSHPAVAQACVVGVPDEAQVERVVAVVEPRKGFETGSALEQEIVAHCQKHLIKWSCPREVSFRTELPLTLLGKVDYRRLQREEAERRAAPRARVTV
jgi:long-chain acyl-CoA synthetase